jgi:3-oxosteroid 1-dehydrogenase
MERDTQTKSDLSRRDFIKTTAAGVGATALTGLGATEAKAAKQSWDYEADVVVVGYGGAGGAAALSANDAGAEVLILQKNPKDKNYSNTRMAGNSACWWTDDATELAKYYQAIAFGVGLPKGFGDPPEVYPRYPKRFTEEITQAWVQTIIDEVPKFWRSLGAASVTSVVGGAAFPTFPGAAHYGRTSFTLPAAWKAESLGGGDDLWVLYAKNIEARGIRVLWGTPGRRLITNADGEVIGIVAEQAGKEIYVKARKAVILTCGGFEYDAELTAAFLQGWGWSWIGAPSNTGDGVRMAMGVGAELTHMTKVAARVCAGGVIVDEIGTGFTVKTDVKANLLVDNYGDRYANELHTSQDPERYYFYTQVTTPNLSRIEFPRIPSWSVFDETVRKAGPLAITMYGAHRVGIHKWSNDNSVEIAKGWILKGDTIEELAQKIAAHPDNLGKMTPIALAYTIAKFNQYSQQGQDPDFGRRPDTLGPLATPPYYAIAMYPGGPNTKGGPTRNGKCQVQSIHGGSIPRLYAAGELGSTLAFSYQACTNVAETTVFGFIAGKNAAAEKSWT